MAADTIDDTLALSRWEGPALVASLGANALQTVHQEYSGERHVRQLLEWFTMQIDRKGLEPAASRAVSP